MHRKRTRRISGILKKSVSWELDSERERSTFGARWGQTNLCATGAARVGAGSRWKSQNRKYVYLSPYVEEPLNSKVIKSFVPELRNRKCFSCFGIPMFYVYIYIWTFYIRFPYSCTGMLQYVHILHITIQQDEYRSVSWKINRLKILCDDRLDSKWCNQTVILTRLHLRKMYV